MVVIVGDVVWVKNKNQSHEQPVTCMKNAVLKSLDVATSVMCILASLKVI